MKTYADIDLMSIAKKTGLNFARHTFGRGQCSCCYGPLDMPGKYWNGGIKAKKFFKENNKKDYTYIIFKNSSNSCSDDFKPIADKDKAYRNILPGTCIAHKFNSDEQKLLVCKLLQEQLGDEYKVVVPQNEYTCIIIEKA